MGPSPELGEYEEYIVKWALECQRKGSPVSKAGIKDSVQRIVQKSQLKTKFVDGRPGNKWLKLFLKRHPSLSLRTPQKLSKTRARITEEDCRKWFQEAGQYLEQNNLMDVFHDKRRIFNCDETALYLNPKEGKVLALRGDKNVYRVAGNDEKENLTVLFNCNAAGELAPPMIVYRYLRIPDDISRSVPENWCIGKSSSGWMKRNTFYEYFANSFIPWLDQEKIDRPVIMFLDGHFSHDTLHLSTLCAENGVELIPLLPNATHLLQPADVAVFRSLKILWLKAVTTWRENNDFEKMLLKDVAPLLKPVLENFPSETIQNGFKACGLCPFTPDVVKYLKFDEPVVEDVGTTEVSCNQKDRPVALIHLENFLGPDKLSEFQRATEIDSVSEVDKSLYSFWLEMKGTENNQSVGANSSHSVSANTVLIPEAEGNFSDLATRLNDTDISVPHNSNESAVAVTSISCNTVVTEHSAVLPGTSGADFVTSTPAKDITPTLDSGHIAHLWPSPVKNSLKWPNPIKVNLKTMKTTNLNRRFHAITSKNYQDYLRKKESEKEQKAKAAEDKKKVRAEKKRQITEEKKKQNSGKKLMKKKKRIEEEEESSSSNEEKSWKESSSDWELSTTSEEDEFEEAQFSVPKDIAVNDFVLIEIQLLKPEKKVYYVGQVLSLPETEGDSFGIKYLRRNSKVPGNVFHFPIVDEIDQVLPAHIKHRMTQMTERKTKRQERYFTFIDEFPL